MSAFGSLAYGLANLFHPRMLWLMVWPMLVALIVWGTVALALWARTALWLADLITRYTANAAAYTAQSKSVWRTDKSKLIIRTKADATKSRIELMFLPWVDPAVALDSYVLHAALLARSRGQQGFIFTPIIGDKLLAASFRTGNRGEKGLPDELFIDAKDAIAKLEPVIPSPETLKARQASR